MNYLKYLIFLVILFICSCNGQTAEKGMFRIKTGAEQTEKYVPLIQNKKIAVVANHSTITTYRQTDLPTPKR